MGDRLAGPSKAGLHVITFEFDFGRGTKAKKRKGFWVERPAVAFVLDAETCPAVWNQNPDRSRINCGWEPWECWTLPWVSSPQAVPASSFPQETCLVGWVYAVYLCGVYGSLMQWLHTMASGRGKVKSSGPGFPLFLRWWLACCFAPSSITGGHRSTGAYSRVRPSIQYGKKKSKNEN